MNRQTSIALGIAGIAFAAQASAQVTFYQGDRFRGQSFTADQSVRNLEREGFNDRASSAIVNGGAWQVCEDARFNGRCVVLQPGQYDSLRAMGLDKEISSVRPAERYGRAGPPATLAAAPPPVYDRPGGYERPPAYDNRPPVADYSRRRDERIYDAPVTSVRAVVGPPEQRCWVERENVTSGGPNVPGAVIGGVLGGILGHQVGAGRGRDVATVGGAIAGAALGGNVNRDDRTNGRDVQRCTNVSANERPDYWDVTYTFEGTEHRVQLDAPPGPTIAVNRDGEPRH